MITPHRINKLDHLFHQRRVRPGSALSHITAQLFNQNAYYQEHVELLFADRAVVFEILEHEKSLESISSSTPTTNNTQP